MTIATPILLLHGALGASEQFSKIIPHVDANFEIHLLDFEGHGKAPLPEHPFSIAQFAQNCIAYMDKHQIAQTNIFGYSMGGYVGLYLAKHFPKRVCSVFTLATKFAWSPESAAREIKGLDPKKIMQKVPQFAESLQKRHGEKWETMLDKTAGMMISLGNHLDVTEGDLKVIAQPVRLSVGDKDKMVGLQETVAAYQQLSNGELQVFPSTKHPIEQTNPEMLAFAINRFFSLSI